MTSIVSLCAYLAQSTYVGGGDESTTRVAHFDDTDSPLRASILVAAKHGLPHFMRYDQVCRHVDVSNVSIEYIHRFKRRAFERRDKAD
ncbi:unnamed protein product [Sphagnum balticum]